MERGRAPLSQTTFRAVHNDASISIGAIAASLIGEGELGRQSAKSNWLSTNGSTHVARVAKTALTHPQQGMLPRGDATGHIKSPTMMACHDSCVWKVGSSAPVNQVVHGRDDAGSASTRLSREREMRRRRLGRIGSPATFASSPASPLVASRFAPAYGTGLDVSAASTST